MRRCSLREPRRCQVKTSVAKSTVEPIAQAASDGTSWGYTSWPAMIGIVIRPRIDSPSHMAAKSHRRKDMGPQGTRASLEPPCHQRRAEGDRDGQQPSSEVARRCREIGRDRAQGERRADGVESLIAEGGRQLRDRWEERERDP